MKLSWILVLLLLAFVAIFSVQNAGVITVHFLAWETSLSAALVIQLAALFGALIGLTVGVCSRRRAARPPAGGPADPLSAPEQDRRSDRL